MPTQISRRKILTLALALTSLCAVVQADTFSSVVVYGDSLSDNGNLFAAVGQPGFPYFQGRRSNGPVAVEQLAASLGAPLVDLAWIGATSGLGNYGDGGTPTSFGAFGLPGMQAVFGATEPGLGPYISGGLFVVWGGANDILAPSPLDTTPQDAVNRAVNDIEGIVAALQGIGVQHILVPGIPDLGLTPYFAGLGPAAAAQATAFSDLFNAELSATLPAGAIFYNTSDLLHNIVANPGAYGFTNVTDPCFNELALTLCANPGEYLFWDSFHPTTATDFFVAQAFEGAVPEPSSIALLLTACALGIGARKRHFDSR